MIDRFERFSVSVLQISHYWHKIADEVMERYGLKGPHAVYLMELFRRSEGATAVELAEFCARDKSDVSRAVASFMQKGLIVKSIASGSHYRARLLLTDLGLKIAKEIQVDVNTAVSSGSKGMTMEELEHFYDALELICANLRKLVEDGTMHHSVASDKE